MTQTIANRYEVLNLLGSGGMADVYLAEDKVLGRKVAVKVLLGRLAASPEFLERFHREARSAAGLSHPHIVAVYDQGECPDGHYIVMEYLKGRTLDQMIKAEGPLPPKTAVEIALQVLSALAFAHQHGIIHRDIKPQNVVIDENGQVKVTDFGIARAADASDKLTRDGSILGTAHYLSPEQARGQEVVKGSDLYSMGVVLYEMISGRVPFEGDNLMAIIHRHLTEMPPALEVLDPLIPINLNNVIGNALIKEPQLRYTSAEELINDLNRCLKGQGVAPRQPAPSLNTTHIVVPPGTVTPPATVVVNTLDCPRCGEANSVAARICRGCGLGISENVPSISSVSPRKSATTRNAKKALLPVVVFIAAILATGGLYLSFRSSNSNTNDNGSGGEPAQQGNANIDAIFRGNPNRTGVYADTGVIPSGALKWKVETGGPIYSSPAVTDNTLYVGSNDNLFYALNAQSGAQKWSFQGSDSMSSSPAVSKGMVYAGSWDGNLYAIDAISGDEKWRYKTGDGIGSSPAVANGKVYIGSWDGYLYAVDATNGSEYWKFRTGDSIYSSPTATDKSVFFGGNDNIFYALDANTGALQWTYHTGGPINAAPALAGGRLYFASADGAVYALDAFSGALTKTFRVSGKTTTYPTILGDSLFVGGDDSRMYAFDINTGDIIWKHELGGTSLASVSCQNGILFFGVSDGYMYALDAASGAEKWKYYTGDRINSTAAIYGSMLFFGSDNGSVYAIS